MANPGNQHRARKRFGQNFLQDDAIISRICACIAPKETDHLIEIGPGKGALTTQLLESGCQLTAIELDRDLIPILNAQFANHTNFTLLQGDALAMNYAEIPAIRAGHKIRVVGNLPYNISTPLLFHLLEYREHITDMYFMLQREVVERLAAPIGGKSYGRLSVMTQYFCEVTALFDVPPESFSPQPKVQSAVVQLVPRTTMTPHCENLYLLEAVLRDAFNQRRKTLRNNLKKHLQAEDFEQLGIDPGARAETLSPENFVTISNYLHSKSSHRPA